MSSNLSFRRFSLLEIGKRKIKIRRLNLGELFEWLSLYQFCLQNRFPQGDFENLIQLSVLEKVDPFLKKEKIEILKAAFHLNFEKSENSAKNTKSPNWLQSLIVRLGFYLHYSKEQVLALYPDEAVIILKELSAILDEDAIRQISAYHPSKENLENLQMRMESRKIFTDESSLDKEALEFLKNTTRRKR